MKNHTFQTEDFFEVEDKGNPFSLYAPTNEAETERFNLAIKEIGLAVDLAKGNLYRLMRYSPTAGNLHTEATVEFFTVNEVCEKYTKIGAEDSYCLDVIWYSIRKYCAQVLGLAISKDLDG